MLKLIGKKILTLLRSKIWFIFTFCDAFMIKNKIHIYISVWTTFQARGYKTIFMLNSAEHEIYPSHKCLNFNIY